MTDRIRYQTIAEDLAEKLGAPLHWQTIARELENARDDGHNEGYGQGRGDTWEEAEQAYNARSLQDEADAYWLEYDRERGAVA